MPRPLQNDGSVGMENVNFGLVETQLPKAKAKADSVASERAAHATDVNSTATSMGGYGHTELTQSLLIRVLYEPLYWYVFVSTKRTK